MAHPLGNFTVNRYAGLTIRAKQVSLEYVVDMAEIPTYQETTQQIDTNKDGTVDDSEIAAYRDKKCREIPHGISIALNDQALALALTTTALEFPPGAGGLPTLRLTCDYQSSWEPLASNRFAFSDSSFADRIGWREIVARGDGTTLSGSDVPSSSISNALRAYPNDLINNPPHAVEAHLSFSVTGARSVSNAPVLSNPADVLDRTKDAFASLIMVSDLTWQVVLFSLLLAVGLGALHAVSPGHGKTIMAAYLVGTRGTIGQALVLGLTVTITHTIGVLALGVITLFAAHYILPERLYPLLSLISGTLVIVMGLALAISRWKIHQETRHHLAHDHLHSVDEHEHLFHSHPHILVAREAGLSWRSLIGLGLAGGLVPSTSALILLLSAISLQRIPFGIVLIVAFGIGMALVLVGVGALLVRASHLLERGRAPARLLQLMPMASAIVVIGAGIVVTAQAVVQLGFKP